MIRYIIEVDSPKIVFEKIQITCSLLIKSGTFMPYFYMPNDKSLGYKIKLLIFFFNLII